MELVGATRGEVVYRMETCTTGTVEEPSDVGCEPIVAAKKGREGTSCAPTSRRCAQQ